MSRFNVASMLARCEVSGSWTDRGTKEWQPDAERNQRLGRATRRIELGKVAFDKLHTADVGEVFALACHETVDDANALAATRKLFCQMRPMNPAPPVTR